MDKSLITKNKIEPLILTSLYPFLVFSIFSSNLVDSSIFILISSEVNLLLSSVYIKLTSSSSVSGLLSFKSCKISFSHSVIFYLYPAKFTILSSLYYSIYGYSFFTTSAKS